MRPFFSRSASGATAAAGVRTVAELVDRYSRPALGLARRIVADDQVAEDVVQESFVAYWRDPAAFDASRGSFESWFLALVHREAVDVLRREVSRRRQSDAAGELPDDAPGRHAADRVEDSRVRTALTQLPAVQREALVLAYWGGFTQREIAARTGAPLGTAKSRMLVGMRTLREGLDAAVLSS